VAASRYGNFNHAVFMCETLPLLYVAVVNEQTRHLPKTLFFDPRYCGEAFKNDHLALIASLARPGRDSLDWVTGAAWAETVMVPSVSRRYGAFRASLMTQFLAERLIADTAGTHARNAHQCIYISRRHASSRVPENIDELEKLALSAGFQPVHLEKISCAEQIAVLRSARAVLAEHGAGLINLTFCRSGTKVFEMFPEAMYRKWTFRMVSYAAGLDYRCGAFPVPAGWVYNRDSVTVDPAYFSKCLINLST
jgi:capsular polysaccharide biosynthesis protein